MFSGKVLEKYDVEGRLVRIRYPVMRDLEDVLAFMNSVIAERKYLGLRKELERDREIEWLSNALRANERGDSIYLVVEVGGEVLGSATVESLGEAMAHVGDFGIALHRSIRGEGIGTRLAETIFSEAMKRLDIDIVKLMVFEKNEGAITFYESLGFERAGRIEDSANLDGEYQNVLIMQKRLE